MALSWSGETAELKDLIDYSRRFRIALIAVTAAAESTLGARRRRGAASADTREACPHNLAPTTSTLMQAALGDALAVALLESRGFTALDFRKLHPGGQLGAMLKFVGNLMHSGDAIPLVALGTVMADAVVEMSTKGFGCVGITDADGSLAGIITDGDLRRHMRPDLLEVRVEDVMTPSPKTVRPGPARQRSAGDHQLVQDHRADRGREQASRSASSISTISCARAWPERKADEWGFSSHWEAPGWRPSVYLTP